jgi:UDP-glucuronate 4-epimerase
MTAHVVVTGGAGFIGSHLCARLCADGHRVTCFDNLDDFYDPAIKQDNLQLLQREPATAHRLAFYRGDILDLDTLHHLFQAEPIDVIIHLAASAGVRPSIEQTLLYGEINVQGTLNLLECCRQYQVQHFVFGSSSSVYGARSQGPFAETDDVSMPVSPYAATKRAGELFCHTYSHLYAMRIACLRFFTVYGPGQRPDLAIHKFARLMSQGQTLPVYGDGSSQRDYTYVDDIVDGIVRACHWLQQGTSDRGICEIFNLGGAHPVSLRDLIHLLEAALGYQASLDWQPMQPGDVPITCADVNKSQTVLGFQSQVDIETGLQHFASWFLPRLSASSTP